MASLPPKASCRPRPEKPGKRFDRQSREKPTGDIGTLYPPEKSTFAIQDLMQHKAIILFDGLCNLCNGTVQFLIRHDREGFYAFAPLQSGFARDLLAKLQHKEQNHKSIILVAGEKVYTRSTAALKICGHLSGGWKLAQFFLIMPRFIRDGVYDFIARHRYRWFGKRQECMLPAPGLEKRFLA